MNNNFLTDRLVNGSKVGYGPFIVARYLLHIGKLHPNVFLIPSYSGSFEHRPVPVLPPSETTLVPWQNPEAYVR